MYRAITDAGMRAYQLDRDGALVKGGLEVCSFTGLVSCLNISALLLSPLPDESTRSIKMHIACSPRQSREQLRRPSRLQTVSWQLMTTWLSASFL